MYIRLHDYGAMQILGRPLGVGEARKLTEIGNLIGAYHSRDKYRDKDNNENWAEWAAKYPELSKNLTNAIMVAENA